MEIKERGEHSWNRNMIKLNWNNNIISVKFDHVSVEILFPKEFFEYKGHLYYIQFI